MNQGQAHYGAKLTDAKVRAMRKLYWCNYINTGCLAKLYGYKIQTIYDAVTYRTWIHVQDTFLSKDIIRPEISREDLTHRR